MNRNEIPSIFLMIGVLVVVSALNVSNANAQTKNLDAVEVSALVELVSADKSKKIEVESHSWNVPLDTTFQTFMGNFSLQLKATKIDSNRVRLTAFLATVGKRPDSHTKRFTMELGLPARMKNIRGKDGASYILTLTPNKFSELGEDYCEFNHWDSSSFRYDPTANFDLHYVPKTLGDFHWNNMKEILEGSYRRFKKAMNLNMPGKMSYYLYPCASPSIGWDSRFGYSIDPTRDVIISIYSHSFVSVSPILANMTRLMRSTGHSPPFLVEGIAGLQNFPEYETLEALRNEELIPITEILTTKGYYSADPVLSVSQAGSFCRYLTDSLSFGKLRRWYVASDDLNIQSKFEEIFGMPIAEVEENWINYLSELWPPKSDFVNRSITEGATLHTELALDLLLTMLKRDQTLADSLRSYFEVAPRYSELGKYKEARRAYKTLFDNAKEGSSQRSSYLHRYADLSKHVGEFDIARESFEKLKEIDTNRRNAADLNLAILDMIEGDTAGAIVSFGNLLKRKVGPIIKLEALLYRATALSVCKDYADRDKARELFSEAKGVANYLAQSAPDNPLHMMRLGLASMGAEDYLSAEQSLELALFLEFRTSFIGRELIALGNLADLKGERAKALEFYRQAKERDNSILTQRSADKYITNSYQFVAK
ncbi:MAG: tetratricopeptide repeat protein [candidate division Zixibacteria bacterium]|nr:tetratricopeptide repeat protein [candidate division Zixibacteria bacterium]